MLLSATCENCLPECTVWIKERSNHWWDHILKSTFNSHDWLENFHMSQSTFLYFMQRTANFHLEERYFDEKGNLSQSAISYSIVVLSNWRRLSDNLSLVWVAKSTVCLVLKDVCTSIVKILLPRYVTFSRRCVERGCRRF